MYYGNKNKKLESKVRQIQDENMKLKLSEEKLLTDVNELKSQLDQYAAYRIIDKKKNNTNNEFADQLINTDFRATYNRHKI